MEILAYLLIEMGPKGTTFAGNLIMYLFCLVVLFLSVFYTRCATECDSQVDVEHQQKEKVNCYKLRKYLTEKN